MNALKELASKWGDIFRLVSGILATVIAVKSLIVPYIFRNVSPAINIIKVQIEETSIYNKASIVIDFKKLRYCSISDAVVTITDTSNATWSLNHNIRTMSLGPSEQKRARFVADLDADFKLAEFRSGNLQLSYDKCKDGQDPKDPVNSSITYERNE
jgi:hypothetical protein